MTTVTAAAAAAIVATRRMKGRQRMRSPWPSTRLTPTRNRNDPAIARANHFQAGSVPTGVAMSWKKLRSQEKW